MFGVLLFKIIQLLHIFFPVHGVVVSDGYIDSVIINTTNTSTIYILDDNYTLPEKRDIERILQLNIYKDYLINKYGYDCDDSSFQLHALVKNLYPGLAFGIMWVIQPKGGGHALNFFIDNKGILWYVEPQTNEIYNTTEDFSFVVII